MCGLTVVCIPPPLSTWCCPITQAGPSWVKHRLRRAQCLILMSPSPPPFTVALELLSPLSPLPSYAAPPRCPGTSTHWSSWGARPRC